MLDKAKTWLAGRAFKAEALTEHALAEDDRAQMGGSANRAVNLVVGLVVAAIVAAYLIPVAVDELVAVDTSSWGSGASSLWSILDLIVVLAIFLFMIGLAVSRR